MIKFFRKIRQRLLTENKFSKYLIYALGEIILVVIGILIALQINNWNENKKRAKFEQESLINLKQDFVYNRNALAKVIEENSVNMKSGIQILNHTGRRFKTNFEIDPILDNLASSSLYFPKNGFLNDLINSGNLGVIQNNLLRNRLSSWMPKLKDLENRQNLTEEFENDMIKYIIKNGSWLNVDEVTPDKTVSKIDLPASGFDVDNNELLKSLEFENMVENRIVFFHLSNERYQECLELNEEILELLNNEIDK